MRQTYPNIELIVIDDGSSDNSDSVIRKSLEKHCHKFRYIRKLNEGVPKTLNLGLKLSSGKYVSIIASDDVMLPQKTEKEVDVFLKSDDNVGMVYSDSIAMNEDGSVLYPYSKVQRHSEGMIFEELLFGECFIPASTPMIKKNVFDIVGCYDESLRIEDFDMWLRISKLFKILYIPIPLTHMRINENSLGSNVAILEKDLLKSIEKLELDDQLRKKSYAYTYLTIGSRYRYTGQKVNGIKYLLKALYNRAGDIYILKNVLYNISLLLLNIFLPQKVFTFLRLYKRQIIKKGFLSQS